ncbi:hypothetical protein Fcan01_10472 [Folsomia candida]|uniref:Uncharacterized protein n=1 Tax=Folsomia candida TaxID=158441 RepID=A0A226EBT0_FOLCA|nr:hypothetical protein Fcan01_10472 [Folsomia candida]
MEIYQRNFLEDITLQFFLDFEDLNNQIYHLIFHRIVTGNPFCPLVLDNVPHWNVKQSRYNYRNLVNQSLPLNTAFSSFFPRFNPRIATFLLPPFDPGPEIYEWKHLLYKVVLGMGLSNENPTYIFIHFDSRVVKGIRFYWPDASLTSSIVMFRGGYPLHILCIPCKKRAVELPRFSTLQNISSAWRNYNANLQNSLVFSFEVIGKQEPEDLSTCVTYNFRNIIPWQVCAEEVIAGKHNFSKYLYRKDMFPNGTMTLKFYKMEVNTPTFHNLANKDFNEKLIMKRSPDRKVWYVHSIDYLPFIFLVIAPRLEMSFETLIMPLDLETWLLTLLSVFSVILTTVYFSRIKSTLRRNLWDKTFWTISTILGQTDGGWTAAEFIKCGGKWFIFIGIWYSVIFLLGNFYQGELFSCMTAKLGPYVPPKLDQLLQETDWDVVTMSDVLIPTGILASTLTEGMIPDHLEGTRNNQTKEFLHRLSERTRFLSGNQFQLAFNITEKIGVISTNGRIVKINLPIIVVDRVFETEIFVEAIQSFLNPIVVRNHAMTPFNSRVPWIGYFAYSGLRPAMRTPASGRPCVLRPPAGHAYSGLRVLRPPEKVAYSGLRRPEYVLQARNSPIYAIGNFAYSGLRPAMRTPASAYSGLRLATCTPASAYSGLQKKLRTPASGGRTGSSPTSTLELHQPNFFEDISIQFILDLQDLKNQIHHLIFHKIISANPFSPLVLDNIQNWDVKQSLYNYRNLMNQSFPLNTAFSKFAARFDPRIATFLLPPFNPGPGIHEWRYLLNQVMLGMGLSNENPTYIFIHFDPRVAASIKFYWSDASLPQKRYKSPRYQILLIRRDIADTILKTSSQHHLVARASLQKLSSRHPYNIPSAFFPPFSFCHQPFQSPEEFKEFDAALCDDDKLSLKRCLMRCGGADCGETIRRMLKKLMVDNVAKYVSLKGQKGNFNFSSTSTCSVVIGATPAAKNFSSTEAEAEEAISSWSEHAPDRIKKNEASKKPRH